MPQSKSETFTATRLTITTSTSYNVVFDKLQKEINAPGPRSINEIREAALNGTAAYTSYFPERIGSLGFTQFFSLDHGSWIRLFGIGDVLRLHRIILGNALIAKTMLEHDSYSGLFAPVEILLKENTSRGTEVVYIMPSSLITAVNPDSRLQAAASALDAKLNALVHSFMTN